MKRALLIGLLGAPAACDIGAPARGSGKIGPLDSGHGPFDAPVGGTDAGIDGVDAGGGPDSGQGSCQFVDMLFVIDNSLSMCSPQAGLSAAFPGFVDAMWDSLPNGTDIHVGITTSSMCSVLGSHSENAKCESGEADNVVGDPTHYLPPDRGTLNGNGYQGRLQEYDGRTYFVANTKDPGTKEPLKTWFSGAARNVGCHGCSFEFSVAGAGYAFSPANAGKNAGFVRDEKAVLLIFIITNEADHTAVVENNDKMIQYVRAAKQACGGDKCIITGAILEKLCVEAGNDNNFRFLSSFGEAPIWGAIDSGGAGTTPDYKAVVGSALAKVIGRTCDDMVF